MTYPCVCGVNHIKKKYADWHTQKLLNRIKRRNTNKEEGEAIK